jgi:hypothetical protein
MPILTPDPNGKGAALYNETDAFRTHDDRLDKGVATGGDEVHDPVELHATEVNELISLLLYMARQVRAISTTSNATQLQGRALASSAPTDGQAVLWDNANATWKPGTVLVAESGNATQLQGRTLANTAPTNGQGLVWDSATSSWKPGAVGSATIAGFPIYGTPSAETPYLMFDATNSRFVFVAGTEAISMCGKPFSGNGVSDGQVMQYNASLGDDGEWMPNDLPS